MSLNLSNFEQAEYIDAPEIPPASIEPDGDLFARAIAGGIAGALISAAVYAVFMTATGLNIGYLAIGVAWVIAKGMNLGSAERGGQKYQITAVVLTYLSVAIAHSGMLWWEVRKQGAVPLSLHNLWALFRFGVVFPITHVMESPGSGLIGLFILFIGMRAAWRMTSGVSSEIHHPFSS